MMTDRQMKKLLALVWGHRLFEAEEAIAGDGASVRVECPGYGSETAEGDGTAEEEPVAPDFVNAAVRYGEIVLHGGVRVDSRSSCWRTEGRMTDPGFDGVAFHVVGERDRVLVRDGRAVRTLILSPSAKLERLYEELLDEATNGSAGCAEFFGGLEAVEQGQILSRLVADRLRRKVVETNAIHRSLGGNSWDETAYVCYLRSLGMGNRKHSYEALARSVPLRCFVRCAGDVRQAEALLLGQSGYLNVASAADPTVRQWQDIYLALKKEYGLRRPVVSWCGGTSVRPSSLPPSMLVQAAALLTQTPLLAERVREASRGGMQGLRELFGGAHPTGISAEKVDLRIINFVIPLLTAMGRAAGDAELQDRAVALYEEVAPERNRYTRLWSEAIDLSSASDSQAVVQLCTEYCARERCAECPVGILRMVRLWKRVRRNER